MYVTNLTARPVGIDGIIVLRPNEENRYIKDTGDLYIKVSKLVAANLVEVSKQPGLTKTINAEAVSVVSVEESAVEATNAVEPVIEAQETEVEQPVVSEASKPMESSAVEVQETKSVTKKRGAKRNASTAKSDDAE